MEYSLIIIFAVFALGFLLGRKKQKNQKQTLENCSHSYAQGLNYLLSNESDKAIQLFVELIKVDGETAETHLALGKLFRSRGEVDKAIKIHTNILAKPSLDVEQRILVLFELGLDYLKSGLLDRAENIFKELLELDSDNVPALVHLQNIYIAEKSWLDAIVYAEQLNKLNHKDSLNIVTHCYCELAEIRIKKNEFHLAKQYLDIAIKNDSRCLRAYILMFEIEIKERNFKQAKMTLAQLTNKHLKHIGLFMHLIFDYFKRQDKVNDFAEFLSKLNPSFENKSINHALLNHYYDSAETAQGNNFLDRVLAHQADLEVFQIALKHLKSEQMTSQKFQQLNQFLSDEVKMKTEYTCAQCGYSSQGMQWQCPSCNSWSSMISKE